NCQHRHDQRNHGEGKLLLKLYFKPCHFKSALLQFLDVASQLVIAHLGRLLHFLAEIRWRLVQFCEGSYLEGIEGGNGCAIELALPALFGDALGHVGLPMRPCRVNSLSDLKAFGIKLKNREVGEGEPLRVIKLIVVNGVVLAENPFALRAQIGLRRLALDAVAQGLLATIDARQVKLIEKEKSCCQHRGNDHDRCHHAVDTDARRLQCSDLVGTRHQAERDQHGHQNRHRQKQVNSPRHQVEQVLADSAHGHTVADNNDQQLKQSKDSKMQHECGQHHAEVNQEV